MKITNRTTKKELKLIIKNLKAELKEATEIKKQYDDFFEHANLLMKEHLEKEKKDLVLLIKFYLVAIIFFIIALWIF